jgi:hypothetical protein
VRVSAPAFGRQRGGFAAASFMAAMYANRRLAALR